MFLSNSMNISTQDLRNRFDDFVKMEDWNLLKSIGIVYPNSFSQTLDAPIGEINAILLDVAGTTISVWGSDKPKKASDVGHYIKFTPIGMELRQLIEIVPHEHLIALYKEAWQRAEISFKEIEM